MKRLLTFLGAGDLHETRYVWNEKEKVTPYASVASYVFLMPEQVWVFLTPEAREKHLTGYRDALALAGHSLSDDCCVDISLGKNEKQLWELFGNIASVVEPGDEIAFDVTNAFRSLPLVSIMAAAYLRTARQVNVSRILYGAYEARDVSTAPSTTPVFDLSPMLDLLSWATAADEFNRSGNGSALAMLLDAKIPGNRLSGSIGEISMALELIRPDRTMMTAARMQEEISTIEQNLSAPDVKPFALILDRIDAAYSPLAFAEPFGETHPVDSLEVERRMIRWYVDRAQWVQAVALSREWVVTYTMIFLGDTNFNEYGGHRQRAEEKLNKVSLKSLDNLDMGNDPLRDMPCLDQITQLWGHDKLYDIRNDIAHAGKRPGSRSPQELLTDILNVANSIESIDLAQLRSFLETYPTP